MYKCSSTIIVALLAFALPRPTSAAIVDFESIPGVGAPTEGLVISNQFFATAGITFALEGGGNPVIAQMGPPTTAFEGFGGAGDTPAPGQGIGSFFLTDDGILSGLTSPPLIVNYIVPTATASGVILDIDFDETFSIDARDSSGAVLQTITIQAGDPVTGNGMATPWSFNRSSADVWSIRFAGSRTAAGAFGLGFDNFDAGTAAPVPEPSTLLLLGAGAAVFSLRLICWRERGRDIILYKGRRGDGSLHRLESCQKLHIAYPA
jgi:hypothetical protein